MIQREIYEIFKRGNYFQTPETCLSFEIESNTLDYVFKISSLKLSFYLIQIGEVSLGIVGFSQYF